MSTLPPKHSSKYSQLGGKQWFENLETVKQNCPITAEFTQIGKTKVAVAKVKFSNGTFLRQTKKAVYQLIKICYIAAAKVMFLEKTTFLKTISLLAAELC